MTSNYITFKEYVKALDDDAMMNKPKLERILKDREEEEREMQKIQMQANVLNSAIGQVMEQESIDSTDKEIDNIANQGNSLAEQIGGETANVV